MTVISLTITESRDQVISGIPRSISVSANIPSTIFYTLDGSTPTVLSSVYVAPILTPENVSSLIFSVFATNGVDTSAVITKTYQTDILNNARIAHAATTNLGNAQQINSQFPFGQNAPNPNFQYLNNANAGITVFDPTKPATPTAFDASGNPTSFTNQPITTYKLIYSESDKEGVTGPGIGNLPSVTDVLGKNAPLEYTQEESHRSDKTFNARALVIYQDASLENPNDPPMINRQSFTLQDSEVVKDGVFFFTNSEELGAPSGSLLRSYYNERDNTITNYFFDSQVNRWIISKYPYVPKDPNATNLSQMISSPKIGNKVFLWYEFPRRVLP